MLDEPTADALDRLISSPMDRRQFMWTAVKAGLSVSAAAALLEACGKSSSSRSATPTSSTPTTAAGPGTGQITLNYIAHQFDPRVAEDKTLIASYQQMYPNVTINQQVIPYPAFTDKLKAAIVGNQVDIFADETPLGTYFGSGAVAPVDFKAMGYASINDLTAKYIPTGLDPFSYHGTLYAIPNEATAYAMYLNTKLFQAAGIDPVAQAPKTWEDVLALSQKLVKKDSQGRFIQRGFDFVYPATNCIISPDDEYFPVIAQKGGKILSADGKSSVFNSPGTVAAFQFMFDWVHKYKLGGPPADDATADFLKGTVAMVLVGPWFEPMLKDQAPDVYANYSVIPVPIFQDTVTPYGAQIDGYGLMVNARSSAATQHAAWHFISWLSHVPVEWVSNTGLIIPRTEVYANQAQIATKIMDLTVFLDALKRPQLGLYNAAHPDKISKAIDDAIDRMTTQSQSPADAVKQADSEIQAALSS